MKETEITDKKASFWKNLFAKLTSRKFIVWVAATVFLAIGFAKSDTVNIDNLVMCWGAISGVYIGGNIAQDFVMGRKER